jgi:site-specific DNA-cytosine methylase
MERDRSALASDNLIQIYDGYNQAVRPELGAVKTNEASPTSSSNLIVFEREHGWAGGEKELPCVRVEGVNSQMLRYPPQSKELETGGYLREMGRHELGKHGLTDYRIRRLTPLECERLQGFPDGWTEGISDTQRYKCLGNAVTVNVIRFLGGRLTFLMKDRGKEVAPVAVDSDLLCRGR